MKVALCTSEAVPFAKTGGMADVCGALPLELAGLNTEMIIVMPGYRAVLNSGAVLKRLDQDFDWAMMGDRVRAYFLRNDMYLRDGLYGDRFGDYPDNLKRFSYFCSKALNLFQKINFKPDVIHCHDWQASLIPVFLNAHGPAYFSQGAKIPKTLLTIHNISYQGIFPKEQMPVTGLGWDYFTVSGLEYYNEINLLKGGIQYCDVINTVSLTHCREVQTKEFGCGLEGVLADRKDRFFGIINGVDYNLWNPQGDQHIFQNYSFDKIEDKKINKIKLQKKCWLLEDEKALLLGFVGRLVEQKGVDLLIKILPKLCQEGIQTVILGTGEAEYEAVIAGLARQYPALIYYSSCFDDVLAHQIYAAADLYLMPSSFEPCGIGQLISFKYGTVPVAYKTGGLADTVIDYRPDNNASNGFVFSKHGESELFSTILRAREVFLDAKKWRELIKRDMRLNFSWKVAARRYAELYEKALAL